MTTLTGSPLVASPRTAARQLCEKLGIQEETTPEEARKWKEFERKSLASSKACIEENIDLFKAGQCSFYMDENGEWHSEEVTRPVPSDRQIVWSSSLGFPPLNGYPVVGERN